MKGLPPFFSPSSAPFGCSLRFIIGKRFLKFAFNNHGKGGTFPDSNKSSRWNDIDLNTSARGLNHLPRTMHCFYDIATNKAWDLCAERYEYENLPLHTM